MMGELLTIFLNVLAPIFSLVVLGYIVGPRLEIHTRSLSRLVYTVLTPAFVFSMLARAELPADVAGRMILYSTTVVLGCALVAFCLARLLRRSAQMTAAYVLSAVFGNVGNFGFPIIQFTFEQDSSHALAAATVYFLVILVLSFVIGVAATNWERGGSLGAILAVARTPALLAMPPAVLLNWAQIELPLPVARSVDLLAAALIPVMLLALGMQLASATIPRLNLDMLIVSAVRLVGGAVLATVLAAPFGLTGTERAVGILQSSMPVAVLASMIATETEVLPNFVIATVLFSTLVSVVTLTLLIAML